ncbi:MAG: hypothetical protein KGZ86_08545, partial [Candidatus Latescibacteria bacterium]|nr:hypothetical protein [Candidatus Latescibacterota bacterium]
LTSDGLCRLVQKLPGQELYSVAKEHQIVNFDSKIAHTLRVEIAGQNFTGYIDGVHCLEDTLEGYQTGNIGLVGRPPNDNEGNNRFFFKDFKIFKLSP